MPIHISTNTSKHKNYLKGKNSAVVGIILILTMVVGLVEQMQLHKDLINLMIHGYPSIYSLFRLLLLLTLFVPRTTRKQKQEHSELSLKTTNQMNNPISMFLLFLKTKYLISEYITNSTIALMSAILEQNRTKSFFSNSTNSSGSIIYPILKCSLSPNIFMNSCYYLTRSSETLSN